MQYIIGNDGNKYKVWKNFAIDRTTHLWGSFFEESYPGCTYNQDSESVTIDGVEYFISLVKVENFRDFQIVELTYRAPEVEPLVEPAIDVAIKKFEEVKSKVTKFHELVQMDAVLAVLDTCKKKHGEERNYIIRNQFINMMPTGETTAWDWVKFSQRFIEWLDENHV